MKKIFTIFFIALIGLNSVGLLFFYWGEIQLCKITADDYIHSSQNVSSKTLLVFSADSKGFQLLNKKEILCNGKMFDIVKTEKLNGKIMYYVFADEKEDALIRGIIQVAKNNSDTKSTSGKNPAPEILKYVSTKNNFNSQPIFAHNQFSKMEFANDSFFYQSPFGSVSSPPPEKFIS